MPEDGLSRRAQTKTQQEEPAPPTPPTSDADAEGDTAKWAILETGVLAVETSLKVIGIDGREVLSNEPFDRGAVIVV